jgi:hypothetical protein
MKWARCSTLPDSVPPDYEAELKRLQDAPTRRSRLRPHRGRASRPLSEAFAHFDRDDRSGIDRPGPLRHCPTAPMSSEGAPAGRDGTGHRSRSARLLSERGGRQFGRYDPVGLASSATPCWASSTMREGRNARRSRRVRGNASVSRRSGGPHADDVLTEQRIRQDRRCARSTPRCRPLPSHAFADAY